MTDAQFAAARATMPWTEHVVTNGRHTFIKIIDNAGREVPLFTMTAFLARITAHLAAASRPAPTNPDVPPAPPL